MAVRRGRRRSRLDSLGMSGLYGRAVVTIRRRGGLWVREKRGLLVRFHRSVRPSHVGISCCMWDIDDHPSASAAIIATT